MTAFRNVHLQPTETTDPDALPRLRFLTNDPAREYAQRPGEVEKLPDSVAAMILCKQGFSKVGRNGVSIDLDGKRLTYWSETSITIATKTGTNEKVLWTVNRHQPDVLHILTPEGEYVETIPLDGKVPWFDEHATKRELGAKRRAQERSMQRVRMLHAPDSQAEIDRADHNTNQITGLVQTFPTKSTGDRGHRISTENVPARARVDRHDRIEGPELGCLPERKALGRSEIRATRPRPSVDTARPASDFSAADRLHQVQANLDRQRTAHAVAVKAEARRIAEVTEDDLNALTDDGDHVEPAVAVTTATENEDLTDLIL